MNRDIILKVGVIAICLLLFAPSFSTAVCALNDIQEKPLSKTQDAGRITQSEKKVSPLEKAINNVPNDEMTFAFQFDKPEIINIMINGRSYQEIITNYPTLDTPGEPVLPIKIVEILIPSKTAIQ